MGSLKTPNIGFPTRFPYGKPYNPVVAPGATDALPIFDGVVFVTYAGVDAMTLGTPVAGVYPGIGSNDLGVPNDDGKRLLVYSTTAFAHTITTAAGKINGTDHIATFGGALGDFIELIAFNGIWYVLSQNGIVLS